MAERLAMNIPEALKQLQQFLLWRYEPGASGKKPNKVPYYASTRIRRNGVQGGPEDRAQLVTFSEAIKVLEDDFFDGIGLAMLPEGGLIGVDLDNCFDGKIKPDLGALVAGTYVEISPSGSGIRAFYFGHYADRKHLESGVEIFHSKGFLTLTGTRLTPDDIIPLPDAVKARLDLIFSSQRKKVDPTEGLNSVRKTDPVYKRLLKLGIVRKDFGDGRIGILCPFKDQHTTGEGDADTVYFLPHFNGFTHGNFHCFHAHCTERLQKDYHEAIGIENENTAGWAELLPLDTQIPPRLPYHEWPPILREYAIAASIETETPVELPALLALGCIATAIQGVAKVEIKPGYLEPCCIYFNLVLPPASRKSAEINRAVRPFVHWEAEQRKCFIEKIKTAESLLATHKARVKELRKRAINDPSGKKAAEIAEELALIEAQEPVIPIVPRIFTSDVTTEHLATMMGQQNGVMAVISSEGGIFETMAGRYNQQTPNIDLYLQAHAGDSVRIDRGSKAPIILDDPRLTMVLAIQPDVVAALSTKPGFRGRGLLGRVIFCFPPPGIGQRTGETQRMHPDVDGAYNSLITTLLNVSNANDPYTLRLEPKAFEEWLSFWKSVEIKLADGGEYEHMRDWAGKLPGAVGRIAALFHSARYPKDLDTRKISLEDMQAAIATGEVLAEHAVLAFTHIGADVDIEDARLLLKWIIRREVKAFTVRDVQRNYGARFKKADDVLPPLDVLKERGFIREIPTKKSGRTCVVYEINPLIFN